MFPGSMNSQPGCPLPPSGHDPHPCPAPVAWLAEPMGRLLVPGRQRPRVCVSEWWCHLAVLRHTAGTYLLQDTHALWFCCSELNG